MPFKTVVQCFDFCIGKHNIVNNTRNSAMQTKTQKTNPITTYEDNNNNKYKSYNYCNRHNVQITILQK